MKAYLMHKDRDFDLAQPLQPRASALVQDLGLDILFTAMAAGDKWLLGVVQKVVLAQATDIETILYRQAVLQDCIGQEAAVRALYALVVETLEAKRQSYYGFGIRYPNSILHSSVHLMEILVGMLRRLRAFADANHAAFACEGFQRLFAMLARDLSDDYFATIRAHLKQLRFPQGILISARLGRGNKGTDYVLRKENEPQGDWLTRLFAPKPPSYSYELPERDEMGPRLLSDLADRGINLVANALAQSVDHITAFFEMLRVELAFYIGCLNLRQTLTAEGSAICFPSPAVADQQKFSATGLYDVCLALKLRRAAVANDVAADGKVVTFITGANQGGKSTFLRSVGLAQLMTQCGMFAGATALQASICSGVFTHYKREEDVEMSSGKFDEELARMSDIIDQLTPGALVLFNESFASTNEREGSQVGRQIVSALITGGVRTVFVTHQFELSDGFYQRHDPFVLFLRAERQESGERTFKIVEGKPLQTSYGKDLYRRIFFAPVTAEQGNEVG